MPVCDRQPLLLSFGAMLAVTKTYLPCAVVGIDSSHYVHRTKKRERKQDLLNKGGIYLLNALRSLLGTVFGI